jgi:nucleoside-diphosphate-sugar epimerase
LPLQVVSMYEPEDIPISEEALIRLVSVYEESKAACENLIHAYSKLYGIKAIILRYANVVGPRLRHGVIWDFINKLKKNPSELEILGDGKQVRSYIYIDDAIEATIIAWRKSANSFEVYNIASEDWITVDKTTRSWMARGCEESSSKNRKIEDVRVQACHEIKRCYQNYDKETSRRIKRPVTKISSN